MPSGRLGRVTVLAAIALVAGVGLCLFDAAEAAGGDLCTSPFHAASALFLAVPLGPTGRFVLGLTPAYRLYLPDLPSPPPKA